MGGGKTEVIYDFTSTEEVLEITLACFTNEIVTKLHSCQTFTITLFVPHGSESITHNLKIGIYRTTWYNFVQIIHNGNQIVPSYADLKLEQSCVNCGNGSFIGMTNRGLIGHSNTTSSVYRADTVFETNDCLKVSSDKPLPIGTKLSMIVRS